MKKREFLINARSNQNMTQADLAKKLEISKSYMCAIESGDRKPSGSLAFKISKMLDVSMEQFYENL